MLVAAQTRYLLWIDQAERVFTPPGDVTPRHAGDATQGLTLGIVRLEDVRVSYGGIKALKGITLEVFPGEIVAMIGANGAGKTTTL